MFSLNNQQIIRNLQQLLKIKHNYTFRKSVELGIKIVITFYILIH